MVNDGHLIGRLTFYRHLIANPAQSKYTQGLSIKFLTKICYRIKIFESNPNTYLVGMERCQPRYHQHQHKGNIRSSLAQNIRRIGNWDATSGSFLQIDLIITHRKQGNCFHRWAEIKELAIDLISANIQDSITLLAIGYPFLIGYFRILRHQ